MLGTKSQQHLEALKTLCESTRPEVSMNIISYGKIFLFLKQNMEQYNFQTKNAILILVEFHKKHYIIST